MRAAARQWRGRLVALVVVAGLLTAFRLAGVDFHPVEIGGAALAGCVLAWALADLVTPATAAGWKPPATRSAMNRGRDYRLTYLTTLLADPDLSAAHRVLADIADRTLATTYGVSLAADPVRAREVLGAEVHDFLVAPPVHSPIDYHRGLPAALTRLELL